MKARNGFCGKQLVVFPRWIVIPTFERRKPAADHKTTELCFTDMRDRSRGIFPIYVKAKILYLLVNANDVIDRSARDHDIVVEKKDKIAGGRSHTGVACRSDALAGIIDHSNQRTIRY